MANNLNDVKSEEVSSTSSATVGSEQQTDVNNNQDSSSGLGESTGGDAKPTETLAEVLNKEFEKSEKDSVSSTETEEETESGSENEPDDKEKSPEVVEKESNFTPEDDKGEKKTEEAVPYNRFKEVNEKFTSVNKELEAVKPIAAAYNQILDYTRKFEITPDQFNGLLQLGALANTDPEGAVKELDALRDKLLSVTGGKLPPDLQKKVDDGVIEVTDAKELAQLRARNQMSQNQLTRTQQQNQEREAQEVQRKSIAAAQTWESTKKNVDPDYKPKASDSDPDGKFELTRDKVLALLNQTDNKGNLVNVIRNDQDMVALMEKAYQSVNGVFARFTNKKATRRVPSSNNSSGNDSRKKLVEAKSFSEAMNITYEKLGI